MAKWEDITTDTPAEKAEPNVYIQNCYNDYGYSDFAPMYSLQDERRNFRKDIQNEIVMEHMKTQNVLGNHITDEIDRNIENTDARSDEIKDEIGDVKATQAEHTTLLNKIWNKVDQLRNAVIG